MEFSRVVRVMQGALKSPSEMACIKPADIICPVIELFNREFIFSINNYKKMLKEACSKDKQNIDILSKKLAHRPLINAVISGLKWGGTFLLGAAWRLQSLRALPITRNNALIGSCLLGCLVAAKFLKNYNSTNTEILRHGSTYRYQWLQLVNSEEEKRLGRIRDTIGKTCKKLVSEIKIIKTTGEHDGVLLNQLNQVNKLFEAIFENELLKSDGIVVRDFIGKKN